MFSKHVAIPLPPGAGGAAAASAAAAAGRAGSTQSTPYGSPSRREPLLDAGGAALPLLDMPLVWQGFQVGGAATAVLPVATQILRAHPGVQGGSRSLPGPVERPYTLFVSQQFAPALLPLGPPPLPRRPPTRRQTWPPPARSSCGASCSRRAGPWRRCWPCPIRRRWQQLHALPGVCAALAHLWPACLPTRPDAHLRARQLVCPAAHLRARQPICPAACSPTHLPARTFLPACLQERLGGGTCDCGLQLARGGAEGAAQVR